MSREKNQRCCQRGSRRNGDGPRRPSAGKCLPCVLELGHRTVGNLQFSTTRRNAGCAGNEHFFGAGCRRSQR